MLPHTSKLQFKTIDNMDLSQMDKSFLFGFKKVDVTLNNVNLIDGNSFVREVSI